MEYRDGRHLCVLCGEQIEFRHGQHARTLLAGSSGKVNMRIVWVDGVEVHRCADIDRMALREIQS